MHYSNCLRDISLSQRDTHYTAVSLRDKTDIGETFYHITELLIVVVPM